MIRISLSCLAADSPQALQPARARICALRAEGHALFRKASKDVLCAAVSVLVENLAHSLRLLLRIPIAAEAKKGLYKIAIQEKDMCGESDLLFASALLGLQSLARQYPKHIHIEEAFISMSFGCKQDEAEHAP